jgi:threonine/homoserine/homoserine lactone efflux protein
MSGDLGFLVRGLVLGFSIAVPVGPIGALCIRRTLAEGRVSGLVTGLGAAAADAVYGLVAALGLTAISSALVQQQFWVRLLGGAFLVYLGVTTFLARPAAEAPPATGAGLAGSFASTFVLTLTNPMTILSFAAVFAGLGLVRAAAPASALALVLGVFLGSAAWWLLLSGGVSLLRSRFDARRLVWLNRISGAVITAFGIVAIAAAWQPVSQGEVR